MVRRRCGWRVDAPHGFRHGHHFQGAHYAAYRAAPVSRRGTTTKTEIGRRVLAVEQAAHKAATEVRAGVRRRPQRRAGTALRAVRGGPRAGAGDRASTTRAGAAAARTPIIDAPGPFTSIGAADHAGRVSPARGSPGEIAILVGGVDGDIAAKPSGRHELTRFLAARKLDLDQNEGTIVERVDLGQNVA
jgi:hypothetical protein